MTPMVVAISDSHNQEVARVLVEDGKVRVEGSFPGGLTEADLCSLGFVHYETDERGELLTRVKEVAPSESLEYVRALFDALPPGFHISNVLSDRVRAERLAKRERFEAEIALLDEED